MSATDIVLHELSYNRPYDVTLDQLIDQLTDPDSTKKYSPILSTFYTECSRSMMKGFVQENEITFATLYKTYQRTTAQGPSRFVDSGAVAETEGTGRKRWRDGELAKFV